MIISARHALISPGRVLRDARIELDNSRIVSVTSGYRRAALLPDIELGDSVLLPGLVNAHSHLELEFCRGQVHYGGDFIAWLQQVRDLKRANSDTVTRRPLDSVRELIAAGCTTLCDHHTARLDFPDLKSEGLRYFAFREFFGFDNHAPDEARMQSEVEDSYAPHAPYTASIEMSRLCRRLADRAGLPMSVHLSESRAEIAFIREGRDASIEALLDRAGQEDADWHGSGLSPIALYAREGLLSPQTYAIHVNYLEPGDLQILADLRPTVVFCPGSHSYFGHDPHPVAELLAAGVPVALGTDSLASNDRISPLHEAALVRQKYPQVGAEQVLAAITSVPLATLGLNGELGRIEPGFLADLAAFTIDGDPGMDFAALFDAAIATGRSCLTMRDGRLLRQANAVAAMH